MRRSCAAATVPLGLVSGAATTLAVLGAAGGLMVPEVRPAHFASWVDAHGVDVAIVSTLWSIVVLWCAYLTIALAVILVRSRQGRVVARVRGVPRWLWRGATRVTGPIAVASVATALVIPAPTASATSALSLSSLSLSSLSLSSQPLSAPHSLQVTPSSIVTSGTGGNGDTDDVVVMERLEFDLAPLQLSGDAHDDAEDVWVVEPGDHLWSIAADQVRAERRDASATTIGRYWHRLALANADRLVVPGQPDLIYPGQRIRLPPVSSVGSRRGR